MDDNELVSNVNTHDIDSTTLQKMIFLYNTLNSGWTVRKITNNKYEFTKPKKNVTKEVNLEDYMKQFIQYNLKIDHITLE
jgi:hypothetical protein